MKKYELTSETKVLFGCTLFRIRALIAFSDVNVGEYGGWIEKEENLDHSGDAWVSGDARVSGNAEVNKSVHLMTVGAIGSRNGCTTFYRTKDKKNQCLLWLLPWNGSRVFGESQADAW